MDIIINAFCANQLHDIRFAPNSIIFIGCSHFSTTLDLYPHVFDKNQKAARLKLQSGWNSKHIFPILIKKSPKD